MVHEQGEHFCINRLCSLPPAACLRSQSNWSPSMIGVMSVGLQQCVVNHNFWSVCRWSRLHQCWSVNVSRTQSDSYI